MLKFNLVGKEDLNCRPENTRRLMKTKFKESLLEFGHER